MGIYFVDYENVGAAGLQGINRLKDGDRVVIFHGMNSGSISFDLHLQIFSSAATIEYIRTGKSAKNYLDFQLATYLGYQIAATNAAEYVIVSRDAGFDSVIDFWTRRAGRMSFRRQASIGISPPSTMNIIKVPTPPAEVIPPPQEVVEQPAPEPIPVAEDEPVTVEAPVEPPVEVPAAVPVVVEPEKPKRTTTRKPKEEPEAKKTTRTKKADEVEEEPEKSKTPARSSKPSAAQVTKPVVVDASIEVADGSEGHKKLPVEFKKLIIDNLKGYKLHVKGFSIIYALMMRYSDIEEFRASLANAFQGKDEDIYNLIVDTYRAYRHSLDSTTTDIEADDMPEVNGIVPAFA